MSHIRSDPTSLEECRDQALLNDWHVVAFSDEIIAGRIEKTTLLGRDLIVWRGEDGQVHVWEDLCVHRGSRLSRGTIRDDKVICPYHGWNYDASGQCVLIPAEPSRQPMKTAKALTHHAQEAYGLVWTCLGTPAKEIPSFPQWDDAGYKKVTCGPYTFKSGYRALENFVDPSHFSFVHPGVNGISDSPDPIPRFNVVETAEGLASTEVRVNQPYGDPREVPVVAFYAYRIMRPLVSSFVKRVVIADPARQHEGNENDRFVTFFTAQMVDQTTSIVRITCAMNFSTMPSDAEVRRRQDLVYAQDSGIVDTQRPERIPLDLRHELHHSSDLLGVKYRRWLDELGVTYGIH